MKNLRRPLPPKSVRFFHCGEYGEKFARPHYHALLFGLDFPDKELWKIENGFPLYRSEKLEKIWDYGIVGIGQLTFETAAYTARYCMKKINGKKAKEINPKTGLKHYELVDEHGQIHPLEPEYTTMSLKPGIGADYYERYKDEIYPDNFIIINGKKCTPPRYYEKRFELDQPEEYQELKSLKRKLQKKNEWNNTPARLHVRETVKIAQTKSLIRGYEKG